MISAGRVLNNSETLSNQKVKNGQQILAVVLSETPDEIEKNENRVKELETIKTDSQLLALDDQYMGVNIDFILSCTNM